MNALPSITSLAQNGVGAGLKPAHYAEILATRPSLSFFEIHAENYMAAGGPAHRWLAAIAEHYPLSVHGVGLSLGSTEKLDRERLARLARVVALYRPALVSEHLAWSDFSGRAFPDLLPLPCDEAALRRTADKIDATQAALKRRILIENPATYLRFAQEALAETQFLRELAAMSGCGLLLDVNNVHVCAVNHGFDGKTYLDAFPLEAVEEIHLAGCAEASDAHGGFLIDDHGAPVRDEVWALYEYVLHKAGPRPTLIEWDNAVPEWPEVFAETQKARAVMASAISLHLPANGERVGVRGRGKESQSGDIGFSRASSASGIIPQPLTPTLSPLKQGEGAKTSEADWQSAFAAALDNPSAPVPPLFAPCDTEKRFAVYRNNSAVAAIGALKAQFPTVLQRVGDEAFCGLARLFARKNPPDSAVLGDYGAGFPDFIATFFAETKQSLTPCLPDCARLDWACLAALRAEEAEPFALTGLAHLDMGRIGETRALPHPSLGLLHSPWPLLALRTAAAESRCGDFLVLRPHAELLLLPCPPGAAAFLRACLAGDTLDAAAEAGAAADEGFDFGACLVELTRLGAFAHFTFSQGAST